MVNESLPRLFALQSQKGGVGKSSLAIAVARLEAEERKTLLIDADLTGTCLLDALSPGDYKDNRPDRNRYFNQMLLSDPDTFLVLTGKAAGDCWGRYIIDMNNTGQSLHFISSDPRFKEVRRIIPSLAQEHHLFFYQHRIQELIRAAICQGYRSIVIDTSPGLTGISEAVLRMIEMENAKDSEPKEKKAKRKFYGFPILVTTTDPMDYRSALHARWWFLNFILYKGQNEPPKAVEAWNKSYAWFNKALPLQGSSVLDPPKDWAKLFEDVIRSMRMRLQESDVEKYKEDLISLREMGGQSSEFELPLIEGFRMYMICSTIDMVKERERQAEQKDHDLILDEMEKWITSLKKLLRRCNGIDEKK